MKPLPDSHLTARQLVVAMVDEKDLPESQRSHLDHCSRCRQALADAKAPLTRFGALARQHTPAPVRSVRIDAVKTGRLKRYGWRPGPASAMAAIALLVIIWTSIVGQDPAPLAVDNGLAVPADDTVFMAEVARLVDDPLPVQYRDLIGVDIADGDGDFMDFIVPPMTGDAPTTSRQHAKGVTPC
ncbi:MAG: hypothetical protein HGJ94_10385 [Desulfosarcina sp.]|nr:hypothetical protein [Desulfosarcina sp.]